MIFADDGIPHSGGDPGHTLPECQIDTFQHRGAVYGVEICYVKVAPGDLLQFDQRQGNGIGPGGGPQGKHSVFGQVRIDF